MNERIRVLIVDDSNFIRMMLRMIVDDTPDMQAVGDASDGVEAIQAVRALKPDVVTMDVEMPNMDGIRAVEAIVAEHGHRVAVIMVSSLTQNGASATLQALTKGAVDFVSKSSDIGGLDISSVDNELLTKIRYWAGKRSHRAARPPAIPAPEQRPGLTPAPGPRTDVPVDLLLIGVSTGGPATLPAFLRELGPLSCTVLIAQHMPDSFTAPFAESLTRDLGYPASRADYNIPLGPGRVYILPGATDAMVRAESGGTGRFFLRRTDGGAVIHPSVDVLFQSGAACAANPVGVILTGMGSDGTEGARDLARRGAPVLVQTPGTAVVSGMPQSAIEAGLASDVLNPSDIARRIARWMSRSA